ncbi:MAG: ADP-glyceromanno-heptose 6-epimerase, partial [Chitinophagaceae bacterium]
MNKSDSIVVTGAAGFIGSCMVSFLNSRGFENLILVDDFSRNDKKENLGGKKFVEKIERTEFFLWLQTNNPDVHAIIHLGARTDTTEFDYSIHEELNVQYSKNIWNYCCEKQIPLVYASSAATYGSGSKGYEDSHTLPYELEPLNPYGISKNEFDKWALKQTQAPPQWYGLKFFNVYGPNEYHKGRMASVVFHSFNQIIKNGSVNLFKSHRADFKDGQQLRDFIYVKDVIAVCFWFLENQATSGLYNLGTGKARSFEDLVNATFAAMNKLPEIHFINMPEDIRDKYQYFTEANMNKLKSAGYMQPFTPLEDGIRDYVTQYLLPNKF